MDGTVLIADDDKTIRTVLSQALIRAGCKVKATSSFTTLIRWISEGLGNVVISDIVMPDGNGLELLPDIRHMRPDLPVIIISAQNTLTTAIKVEKEKAFDYLAKPFDLSDLLQKVSLSLKTKERGSKKNLPNLKEELPLIGSSTVMLDLYRVLAKLMNLDQPVFIGGESGTGKTLIAETIHNFSDRRNLPLVIPLTESFSDFETCLSLIEGAKGGSILIEDVDGFGQKHQTNLIRLLDYKFKNSPRFLVTSKTLNQSIAINVDFDPSLLFRLNKFTVSVPSLRHRLGDINDLYESFKERNDVYGQESIGIEADAIKLMKEYYWPGNVRQFYNVLYSLFLGNVGSTITTEQVFKIISIQPKYGETTEQKKLSDSVGYYLEKYFDKHGSLLPPKGIYRRIINEVEVPLIQIALKACKGNQLKCAQLLGLNRNTLRKKIERIDIHVTKYKRLM